MPTLSAGRIADLLQPFLEDGASAPPLPLATVQLEAFSRYLDVLLHWNQRMNLTAVRKPEDAVTRHFGESLFLARHLAAYVRSGALPLTATLLDIGSGAGFPGLPIAIVLPAMHVTLAESHQKKAAFLREAVRVTGATAEVWAGRAEAMPQERLFDTVTLRAVDDMQNAQDAAARHARVLVATLGPSPSADVLVVPSSMTKLAFLWMQQTSTESPKSS